MSALPVSGSGARDFDFFLGNWAVSHRRLIRRLEGCTDWETFGGAAATRPILGGMGNLDDNVLHLPAGSYRVLVQDQRGCTIDTIFTLAQPPALALQTSATLGDICDPDAVDALSANASGGT